ncbi:2-keto-4-pentenoate hydratase [Neobacillus sp. NPDC093127]|uniref:2-keto-4-pentenoate hydratase n=1 Tax=Neobacillus sp. NPDC093127 TaxID=3364296 RepID=UPI003811FE5A
MANQTETKIQELSEHIAKAYELKEGVRPVTELVPDLEIDKAYAIQLETINVQLATGKKITGKKIGLTSAAMQKSLGVDEPDYGHLFDDMAYENNATVPFDRLLQPRVEGEIAFVLKKDLAGPNVTSFDVMMATDYVVPALEIVDSRIKDWKIKLEDTVADNGSSALYVLGNNPTKLTDIDLKMVGMTFYKNGKLVNSGIGAAALGDPAKCVAWLANKLAAYDITLKAGEVILSGALSAAIPAEPGDSFTAKFSHFGEVTVTFSKE